MKNIFRPNTGWAVLIIAMVILYGSFYPFAFHGPLDHDGPFLDLLKTWRNKPGRGDFLANILLYTPLGFFGFYALKKEGLPLINRYAISIGMGVALSTFVELTQYYDTGRDQELTDILANVTGTTCGAVAAMLIIGNYLTQITKGRLQIAESAKPVPLMLIGALGAYKLFPYAPVIDMHKYYHAIRSLFDPSLFDVSSVIAHVVTWTTLIQLARAAVGRKVFLAFLSLFLAVFVLGKIFIVSLGFNPSEVIAIAIAITAIPLIIRFEKTALLVNCVALGALIIVQRLSPFHFQPQARAFGWIPFHSFLFGSLELNSLTFLEKFYEYGAMLWIVREIGVKLWTATILMAGVLFLLSWAEIYLPGRSAEITDAMLAIMIGALLRLADQS